MKSTTRTIEEHEISEASELLFKFSNNHNNLIQNGSTGPEEIHKAITAQYHRQKELVIGEYEAYSNKLQGVVVGTGQGDTVAITHIATSGENTHNQQVKRLITALEKNSRRYGYSRIFLSCSLEYKNFFITAGYKPRLLFTFSTKRKEVFDVLCELYPMWVEVTGSKVKIILGGDHLEEDTKNKLTRLPVTTDFLFLKNL